MKPTIAARLAAINDLCEKIAHLAPVSEPVTPEDYVEMLKRLDELVSLSLSLYSATGDNYGQLDDYKSDWISDWKEKSTRDADLFGMHNKDFLPPKDR